MAWQGIAGLIFNLGYYIWETEFAGALFGPLF